MSLASQLKRGLSYQEAMDYVGVKRRTFDEAWRPRLVAMPQGSSLIFDRQDLDALFEEFKAAAAGQPAEAANEPGEAHNAPRNGRPSLQKGVHTWANKHRGSTLTKTIPGKSTSGGARLDFASVASSVLKKRTAG